MTRLSPSAHLSARRRLLVSRVKLLALKLIGGARALRGPLGTSRRFNQIPQEGESNCGSVFIKVTVELVVVDLLAPGWWICE